jgi:hypothetical protein
MPPLATASGAGSAAAGGGASAEDDGGGDVGSDPHDINPPAAKSTPNIHAIFISQK